MTHMADTKVLRDEDGEIIAVDGGNVQRRCVIDNIELMVRIVEKVSGTKRPPNATPMECIAGLVQSMQDEEDEVGDAEPFFEFLNIAASVAVEYFCECMAEAEPVQ